MSKSILVGIPHTGTWKGEFGASLARMCAFSAARGDREISVLPLSGSMLSHQRTGIVKEALSRKVNYLLFLDCDMVFPEDTLERLLAWEKQVVAVNYVMKMIPAQPITRKWKDDEWKMVYTHKASSGLEEVHRVGLGITLIDMGIFPAVQEPWFLFPWMNEKEGYFGEDWWFCERVEEAGVKIFVDHGVSQLVGHMGDVVYKHIHVRPEMIKRAAGVHHRKFADRGVTGAGNILLSARKTPLPATESELAIVE